MGSVGDFIFGSPSKASQNSASTSQYSNQSNSASQSGNLAYPQLSQSLGQTTGFTPAAGNWMAALLGIPMGGSGGGESPPPSTGGGGGNEHTPPPITLPPINRTPPPAMPTTPIGSLLDHVIPVAGKPQYPAGGLGDITYIKKRELGGPVNAGQPYLVGEKRPEVFVPHTSGTILPKVPQTMAPTALPSTQSAPMSPQETALTNYSKSGGMDFLLNQGVNNLYSSRAAKGIFQSGATGQALEGLRNNLASTYLDNYLNHVLDVAKLGLGSAGTLAQAGQYSNSASQSYGQGTSSSVGTGTSKGAKEGLLPGMAAGAAQAAAAGG